jgi:hypothetical protein
LFISLKCLHLMQYSAHLQVNEHFKAAPASYQLDCYFRKLNYNYKFFIGILSVRFDLIIRFLFRLLN